MAATLHAVRRDFQVPVPDRRRGGTSLVLAPCDQRKGGTSGTCGSRDCLQGAGLPAAAVAPPFLTSAMGVLPLLTETR